MYYSENQIQQALQLCLYNTLTPNEIILNLKNELTKYSVLGFFHNQSIEELYKFLLSKPEIQNNLLDFLFEFKYQLDMISQPQEITFTDTIRSFISNSNLPDNIKDIYNTIHENIDLIVECCFVLRLYINTFERLVNERNNLFNRPLYPQQYQEEYQ